MAKEMADTDMLKGIASFNIDVAGAGSSVAAIMAGLNGETSLVMGKGRMKSAALNTLIGGPTQILSDVFTGGDSDYTAINCAVVRFPVKGGVATAAPLVLDTEVAAFIGEGTINLGSEVLALVIEPDVKTDPKKLYTRLFAGDDYREHVDDVTSLILADAKTLSGKLGKDEQLTEVGCIDCLS